MKDISYPLQSRYYTKAHTQTCVDKRNKATNMIRNAFFFFVISLHCRYNYIAVCIWTKMLKFQRHAHIYIPIKCLRHTPERPPHTIHTTWVHFGECPVRSSILGSFESHTHTHTQRGASETKGQGRGWEREWETMKNSHWTALLCASLPMTLWVPMDTCPHPPKHIYAFQYIIKWFLWRVLSIHIAFVFGLYAGTVHAVCIRPRHLNRFVQGTWYPLRSTYVFIGWVNNMAVTCS